MLDLWYHGAIASYLDVRTFSDGMGGFCGLCQEVPHPSGIGATCT